MRDPGHGVGKGFRGQPGRYRAGSTDVSQSPAARAGRSVNKFLTRGDASPGHVRNNAPSPVNRPLDSATGKALVEYLNLHHPGVNVGAYGGLNGLISHFPDVQRFLGSKTTGQHVQGTPAIGSKVAPAKSDAIDRSMHNGAGAAFTDSTSAPPSSHTPPKVKAPGSTVPYQHSPGVTPGQGSDTPPTPPTDPTNTILQDLLKQAGGMGTMVDAKGLAKQLADAQYGPVIANLLQAQVTNGLQGKQNEGDINNWYGQVDQSRTKAASDLKTANDAAVGSLGDTLKGITGSIGGAANQGSAQVDAVGQNGINTEKALGSIQQGYLSSLAPLLALAQGGAVSAEHARTNQNSLDLAGQTASQQGAQQAAQLQAMLGFQQQNSGVAQQRFQNKFGILQAILAQQLAGQKASDASLVDTARIKSYNANADAATLRAKTAAYKAAHPAPGKNSFAAASPQAKQAIALALATAGKNAGGAKNVHGAWNAIAQGIAASGWNPNDPTIKSWLGSAVLPGAGLNSGMIWGG